MLADDVEEIAGGADAAEIGAKAGVDRFPCLAFVMADDDGSLVSHRYESLLPSDATPLSDCLVRP